MYPGADIPVVQLSLDRKASREEHYRLGRLISPLRDEGVLIFASGNVVDRTGYESAVLAVTVEASQTATIKVETADSTAGPYEPVKDSRIFVDNPVNEDGEAVIENEAEAQAVANLDIDLIGCKSCVKITATNGTIGALALGDATNCPVKESI